MPVVLINTPQYYCHCDICNKIEVVERTQKIYNAAQAVRSLGWSFGKDRRVTCNKCRKLNYNDNYKWGK